MANRSSRLTSVTPIYLRSALRRKANWHSTKSMQLIPMAPRIIRTILWNRPLPFTWLLLRSSCISRNNLFPYTSVLHSPPIPSSAIYLTLLLVHPWPSLICEGVWLCLTLGYLLSWWLSCGSSRASSQHVYSTQSFLPVIICSIVYIFRDNLLSSSAKRGIVIWNILICGLEPWLPLVALIVSLNFGTFVLWWWV
jgi:hypothetical protein